MPGRQEAAEHLGVGRFDLAPQDRQACPPQAPQHVRVAPLDARSAGHELAADHGPARLEDPEHGLGGVAGDREAVGKVGGDEGPARGRMAADDPDQGLGDRFQEHRRQPAGGITPSPSR